jgi:phosphoribosylanthranilate isomerase
MPKVKVKICGITNWPDARRAIEGGANFLGFNFYSGSPRYITPEKTKTIVERLPKGVSAVGVFVNETEETVLATAAIAGLDYVQLHGDETPQTVARLKRKLPVIKALRVKQPFQTSQLARYKQADALLLDGFDSKQRGGTGKTFDWKIARQASKSYRIFLAGGLTVENVEGAVDVAAPYAVDVCSGVEAKPGKKDAARMKAFLQAATSNGKAKKSGRAK